MRTMRLGMLKGVAYAVALTAGALLLPTSVAAQIKSNCQVRHDALSDADAALSREDYATAIELYKKMAADSPDVSRAGIIRSLLGQDKVKDAEDLGQSWFKESPKNATAVETLGEVFFREADLGGAYSMNQAAHQLDPCNARVYLMDAALEELTANRKSGRGHIELAYKLFPQEPEIRRAWISTLPRKQRLAEREALLKDESLIGKEEKKQLQRSAAYAAIAPKEECTLATNVTSTKIPIVEIMDSIYHTGEAGINIRVNGKERRLQLDTGASGITISKSAAEGLGLVRELSTEVGGIGDKGNVGTSIAHAASIKIGNLEFHNCEVDILEKRSALDNEGLIGADVFSKFLVSLDFYHLEMRLDPLPPLPNAASAETHEALTTAVRPQETAVAADEDMEEKVHDRYIAPEMKDWTKIYRVGHDLLMPVTINDSKVRLFLVDTGAASMLISPGVARDFTKVHKDPYNRIMGLSGEVRDVYETSKFKIVLGDFYDKIESMTAIDMTKISHETGVEVSGIIGAPILFQVTVRIDYRDNLIKLLKEKF